MEKTKAFDPKKDEVLPLLPTIFECGVLSPLEAPTESLELPGLYTVHNFEIHWFFLREAYLLDCGEDHTDSSERFAHAKSPCRVNQ